MLDKSLRPERWAVQSQETIVPNGKLSHEFRFEVGGKTGKFASVRVHLGQPLAGQQDKAAEEESVFTPK
jgi:hypothetical protein